MNRRSFFGLLAGIPFFGGVLAPKPVAALPLPVEPERLHIWRKSTHRNLKKLFEEIRAFVKEHPGTTVLCSDDPVNRLIGWSAFVDEGCNQISLDCNIRLSSLIGNGLLGFSESEQETLRTSLRTAKGRQFLAKALMKPVSRA